MEWTKNNLPLVTIILLIVGLFRITLSYYYFDIDIFSYIELSEIIQLQSIYLVLLAMSFILLWFAFELKGRNLSSIEFDILAKDTFEDVQNSYAEKLNEEIKNLSNYSEEDKKQKLQKAQKELINHKIESKIQAYNIFLASFVPPVTLVAISAIITILITSLQNYILFNLKSNNEITATINNVPMKTSSSFIYIGRVKNYIFFYDKQKSKSYVYSNSDVKNLTLSRGEKYSTFEEQDKKPKTLLPIQIK